MKQIHCVIHAKDEKEAIEKVKGSLVCDWASLQVMSHAIEHNRVYSVTVQIPENEVITIGQEQVMAEGEPDNLELIEQELDNMEILPHPTRTYPIQVTPPDHSLEIAKLQVARDIVVRIGINPSELEKVATQFLVKVLGGNPDCPTPVQEVKKVEVPVAEKGIKTDPASIIELLERLRLEIIQHNVHVTHISHPQLICDLVNMKTALGRLGIQQELPEEVRGALLMAKDALRVWGVMEKTGKEKIMMEITKILECYR